jgi:hypothetical protein
MHAAQFLTGVDLKAQMIDTHWLAMRRDREIDPRIFEHPFGVIRLKNGRLGGEQRRIESDGFVQVVDADV